MKLVCPSCRGIVNVENVNIETNLAKCIKCNSIHKANELVNFKSDQVEEYSFTSSPPLGSKIEVTKKFRNEYEIYFPAKGFTTSSIPLLLFAMFWLAFIAFWTWGASQGSVLFALFSIPFWLVGIAMIIGVVNAARASQTIIISRNDISVNKNKLLFSKKHKITYKEIQSVRLMLLNSKSFSSFSNMQYALKSTKLPGVISAPAVLTGSKTIYFYEQANDAEQEWIVGFLNGLIEDIRQYIN